MQWVMLHIRQTAQVTLYTAVSMMHAGGIVHPAEKSTCHLKAFKDSADLQELCHAVCAVWGVEGTA